MGDFAQSLSIGMDLKTRIEIVKCYYASSRIPAQTLLFKLQRRFGKGFFWSRRLQDDPSVDEGVVGDELENGR